MQWKQCCQSRIAVNRGLFKFAIPQCHSITIATIWQHFELNRVSLNNHGLLKTLLCCGAITWLKLLFDNIEWKFWSFTLWDEESSPLIPITSAPAFLNFSYESLKAQACNNKLIKLACGPITISEEQCGLYIYKATLTVLTNCSILPFPFDKKKQCLPAWNEMKYWPVWYSQGFHQQGRNRQQQVFLWTWRESQSCHLDLSA